MNVRTKKKYVRTQSTARLGHGQLIDECTNFCLFSILDEGEKVNHRFSEPWEDSDVILVVENEKFHVHRLILSMNSPVFKAMFKSEFKEATDNEIPLPEKNASEVLDFLKQLYIQERQEISSK